MRKVLFRGKRLSDGEWVYGDLLTKYPHHKGATIVVGGCVYHEVDPATVGQYTGVRDKNLIRVFDRDIITILPFPASREIVIYDPDVLAYVVSFGYWYKHLADIRYICRVIGNAYDNPELLAISTTTKNCRKGGVTNE